MSKMPRTRPLLRLIPCLSFVLLTSCASKPQPSAESFSPIVEKTSREVKDAACIALKPDKLTSEEEANVMLLNYAAKEAASWLAFGCRV